jgi:polyphosphate kinase
MKKSKEYITLERFSEYFEVPESLDLSLIDRNQSDKLKKEGTSNEIEMFDVEEEYLIILKDIFDTIPRIYQNYIVVNDFVSIAQKDPQVLAISDELCRIQSV